MLRRSFLIAGLLLSTEGCGGCDIFIDKHDALVAKYEDCDAKWADLEAQYQRRFDMIPRLTTVVKKGAAHEKETLTAVTEARAKATQVKLSAEDLSDPAKVAAFQKAQGEVSSALSKLMAIRESYPDLKSNQLFSNLMVQIEGTENRILRARTEYNQSVRAYNVELRKVSGKVFNPLTGNEFKPRVYFKAREGADKAPEIDL